MIIGRAQFNSYAEAVAFLKRNPPKSKEAVVVLSRHGQTVFNVGHRLQDRKLDEDRLTLRGIREAQRLETALSPFPIEWAASSDLIRAIQTTQLALPARGVERLFCLGEYDFGDLGGLIWRSKGGIKSEFEERYPNEYRLFFNDRLNFSAPGGENYAAFSTRVVGGFERDFLPRARGKIAFGLSHKSTIRELLLRIVYGTNINEYKPTVDNTSITIIYFREDGSPDLLLLNNTEHLGIRIKTDPRWDPSRPQVIKKILIVEDEPHKVKAFQDFLAMNYPIVEVVMMGGGGYDFTDRVMTEGFDLVLMDEDLTVAKGILLLRELRKKGFTGLIAANSASEKENRAMVSEGADFSIGKNLPRFAEYLV